MSELRACDRTPAARAARSACLSHGVSHGVWSVRWCAVRISHISYRARARSRHHPSRADRA